MHEACAQFDREAPRRALLRARAALGRLNGLLLLDADAAGVVLAWLTELEGAVLPAVVGFARWADQPPSPSRR